MTLLDGPLGPGKYQLTVAASLTDLVGNPLDGNADGTGGDALVRHFTVNGIPSGTTFEGTSNSDFASASALTLAQDATVGQFYFTQLKGIGSIDPGDDADFWKFYRQGGGSYRGLVHGSRWVFPGIDSALQLQWELCHGGLQFRSGQ